MTLDDFEWVEDGFDVHLLVHREREMTIAVIKNFKGWYIQVLKSPRSTEEIAEHVDNLETAKVIAAINVNQYMGDYPNVNTYRKRTANPRPEAVPARVFKVV
jgi:hypothetical protein